MYQHDICSDSCNIGTRASRDMDRLVTRVVKDMQKSRKKYDLGTYLPQQEKEYFFFKIRLSNMIPKEKFRSVLLNSISSTKKIRLGERTFHLKTLYLAICQLLYAKVRVWVSVRVWVRVRVRVWVPVRVMVRVRTGR